MRFWLLKFSKLDIKQQSHRKILIDTFVNSFSDMARSFQEALRLLVGAKPRRL